MGLCAAASLFFQWDEHVQGSTYDWMVKHRLRTPDADRDIVIIDIDEKSLAQMSAEFGSWPWPRDVFAAILTELESQKAQAIVFDILFSDTDRQHTEGDRVFSDVIARSHTSYFPVLRLNPKNDAISAIRAADHPALITPEAGHTRSQERTLALVFPYFASAVGSDRFGTFNVFPDADGVIRHQTLWENVEGWRINSLPMSLASASGWPPPDKQNHLVRWMDKPLAYKTVSFSDLYLNSQKKNKTGPSDEFTGKIVLIGSTAPGLSDLKGTSMTSIHPGVDILATEIDNLKNRRYINEVPGWMHFVTTIGLLMLATWLSLRYSGLRLTFILISMPCILFLLSYLSLNYLNTFIDLTTSASYVLTYLAIARLHEFYLMQKEKEKAQAAALQSQQTMLATLRQSEKELEQKVLERTEALAQKNNELNDALSQLTEQKEVAESANLAKSRFLAAASHDLRQPMHTVSLLVGLLREQSRYPEVNNIVGKIQASVQAMGDMFGSLLDISKFDAGAVLPHWQEFAIDELLHRLVINYEAQANEKGLKLRVIPSRAWVKSDPALLERILGNLVSNAIRYTQRGCVLVGCRRRNSTLIVQVIDSGIGIAESQRDNIFEEFFQIANSERDRSKGLGLGLSIVKRSAALLGHNLTLHSELGKGTCFSIELPLLTAKGKYKTAAIMAPESTRLLAQAFIVVIEDGSENREAIEALLHQWGCHVVSAESSHDALNALQDHLRTPDLIITDYRLRDGLDGFMAIEEIRLWAEQKIPAIVVTGDLAADNHLSPDNDITLLHKPVDSHQLQKLAEGLLSN
ncbi:MAG: CHASE2 domain-containing protein [Burkholderiaceae bacterium]